MKPCIASKTNKVRSNTGLNTFDFSLSGTTFDGGVYLSDCVDFLDSADPDIFDKTHDHGDCDQDFILMAFLLKTLCKSETGQALLDDAYNHEWFICLDDLDERDFDLDIPEQTLTLNSRGLSIASLFKSHYFTCQMSLSLARALRDMWQETRYGSFAELFKADYIISFDRIRSADCETLAAVIAWECAQEGATALWRHLIASDEGDIAMAFKNNLNEDSHDNDIYTAMNCAFNQWFASEERINACDHGSLNYMDDLLSHDGSDAFGAMPIQPCDLEALSCLPNRTAYLQGRGAELLYNALYCGMNDSINHAHFTQIIHDASSVHVGGVDFRDAELAAKIFPDLLQSSTIHA